MNLLTSMDIVWVFSNTNSSIRLFNNFILKNLTDNIQLYA